jgi:predicted membrane protein
LFLPEDVGLSLTANGFVSSIKTNGHKEERILTPLKWQSDDYKAFERRVRLDMAGFVSEVKVRFL